MSLLRRRGVLRVAVLALGALAFRDDLDVALDVFPGAETGARVPLVATAMILIDLGGWE